jgi:hypothetical protein
MRAARVAAGCIALLALAPETRAQQESAGREPYRFLRTSGFAPADLDRLDRGEPLARVLDTDKREVAIVGAIRIAAPRERLLDRYRDIPRLRGQIVLQAAAFSVPPKVSDLAQLGIEAYDIDTIRACKPGNCGVRLSADNLAVFNRDVNWRAADWRPQAESVFRRLLGEYAAAYRATGALAEYTNKAEPLSVAEEFAAIFEQSRYFATTAPEFFTYLRNFPRAKLPGAEDILYWSKEDFGLRPVTSVTHLIIAPPSISARPALIATKQIFATHYFDAALGLSLAFDDGAGGFYMTVINRARTRSLTSFTRMMARSMVLRRSRDGLEDMLRSTKLSLERGRAQ